MRLDVWAPRADSSVELVTPVSKRLMERVEGGWWSVDAELEGHGERYGYSIDGGPVRPDPRSRRQPEGVHDLSATYDHDLFDWSDADWRGIDNIAAVYELHVGTFTDAGTFDAAIDHLEHLVDLGVSHIEVMPIAAFDGPHGWGYDGVALYAVHEPYGGPDGFKRFVDACHGHGLAVLLDVVYNHLGPSGNYLAEFGPYFTDAYGTPWGSAVNLDRPGSDAVRAYFIDNAVGWCRHFHCDGLRLDATHELHDRRATHFLEELTAAVHTMAAAAERRVHVVAESDRNDPRTVTPRAAGGLGADAQWDDDVHHAIHAAVTGERHGYYIDFGSMSTIARTWQRVFHHDGTYSPFRGRHHGRVVAPDVPSTRFVTCLQNHDQVGNRAAGARITTLATPRSCEVAAALAVLGPFTPLLFMGEEWGATTPWPYFTSFPDPELGEQVRAGRRAEFADHGWDPDLVPDPQSIATRDSAVLQWIERSAPASRRFLDWYRNLLALRRQHHVDLVNRPRDIDLAVDDERRAIARLAGSLLLTANLDQDEVELPLPKAAMDVADWELVACNDDRCSVGSGWALLGPTTAAIYRVVR